MCDYKPWWIFISVYLELKLRLLYTILLLVNSVVACCVNTVILDIVLMSYFHNSLSMFPTVAPESAFACQSHYSTFFSKIRLHSVSHSLFWPIIAHHFFVCLFVFGCAGSLLLLWTFSSCRERGLLSSCGAEASHCSGFSS